MSHAFLRSRALSRPRAQLGKIARALAHLDLLPSLTSQHIFTHRLLLRPPSKHNAVDFLPFSPRPSRQTWPARPPSALPRSLQRTRRRSCAPVTSSGPSLTRQCCYHQQRPTLPPSVNEQTVASTRSLHRRWPRATRQEHHQQRTMALQPSRTPQVQRGLLQTRSSRNDVDELLPENWQYSSNSSANAHCLLKHNELNWRAQWA